MSCSISKREDNGEKTDFQRVVIGGSELKGIDSYPENPCVFLFVVDEDGHLDRYYAGF